MASMKTVTAFVKPEGYRPICQPCIATERKLDALGVPYTAEDATTEESLALIKGELGYMQSPVVVVRDETGTIIDHWYGYRPDLLEALAKAA